MTKCTCDAFCDDPCPVHAAANAKQDRALRKSTLNKIRESLRGIDGNWCVVKRDVLAICATGYYSDTDEQPLVLAHKATEKELEIMAGAPRNLQFCLDYIAQLETRIEYYTSEVPPTPHPNHGRDVIKRYGNAYLVVRRTHMNAKALDSTVAIPLSPLPPISTCPEGVMIGNVRIHGWSMEEVLPLLATKR